MYAFFQSRRRKSNHFFGAKYFVSSDGAIVLEDIPIGLVIDSYLLDWKVSLIYKG